MSGEARTDLPAGTPAWGLDRHGAACPACGQTWLVPASSVHAGCPCGSGALDPADARIPARPEQVLPLALDRGAVADALRRLLGRAWHRDKRLSAEDLAARATLVWSPTWLVDATVRGRWTAEVGFDYEAKSTVEHLHDGRWTSTEQVDVRVRWEPRAGTLERRYDNVQTVALDAPGPAFRLQAHGEPAAFTADALAGGWVRVPDLAPDAVWERAEPAFRARAADDVRRATGAQHVRDVHLAPAFADDTWTVRLRPTWRTWYRLDDGTVVPLHIDGTSGFGHGAVFASTRRGWAVGGIIAAIALGALILAGVLALVGLAFPPVWALAGIVAVLGLAGLAGAFVPISLVWLHNARQREILAQG